VSVRNGVTPEGDDPNDVLMRDFAVRSGADDGAESLVLPFERLRPVPADGSHRDSGDMTASRCEPPLPADAVFVDTTGLVAPTM